MIFGRNTFLCVAMVCAAFTSVGCGEEAANDDVTLDSSDVTSDEALVTCYEYVTGTVTRKEPGCWSGYLCVDTYAYNWVDLCFTEPDCQGTVVMGAGCGSGYDWQIIEGLLGYDCVKCECPEGYVLSSNMYDCRCKKPTTPCCGNGVVESGEVCDDGNPYDGDACSSTCKKGNGEYCSSNAECSSGRCAAYCNLDAPWSAYCSLANCYGYPGQCGARGGSCTQKCGPANCL